MALPNLPHEAGEFHGSYANMRHDFPFKCVLVQNFNHLSVCTPPNDFVPLVIRVGSPRKGLWGIGASNRALIACGTLAGLGHIFVHVMHHAARCSPSHALAHSNARHTPCGNPAETAELEVIGAVRTLPLVVQGTRPGAEAEPTSRNIHHSKFDYVKTTPVLRVSLKGKNFYPQGTSVTFFSPEHTVVTALLISAG